MPKGATESVTDTEMCMPVDQCRQLLVELQDLRLKITAMEQAGAEVVMGAQQRIPDTDQ
jgi:cytidine deaminase